MCLMTLHFCGCEELGRSRFLEDGLRADRSRYIPYVDVYVLTVIPRTKSLYDLALQTGIPSQNSHVHLP